VRTLDDYIGDRTSGPIFISGADAHRYSYQLAYEQVGRLCRAGGLTAEVTPHSLRHSYATESLRLGARYKTSRTRSATRTPAPPGATTEADTTSTAPPITLLATAD